MCSVAYPVGDVVGSFQRCVAYPVGAVVGSFQRCVAYPVGAVVGSFQRRVAYPVGDVVGRRLSQTDVWSLWQWAVCKTGEISSPIGTVCCGGGQGGMLCRDWLGSVNYCYWSLSYSDIHCSQADSLCSCRMGFRMSNYPFAAHSFFIVHQSGVLTVLLITWLVPHETAAILAQVLCPYSHAPVYCVILLKDA